MSDAKWWPFCSGLIVGFRSTGGNEATRFFHYTDVIISAMVSQITSFTIVYTTVYSGADQRKHQSSASLAFVREIHRGPVNSPHKRPVTRKVFPFDDVIMLFDIYYIHISRTACSVPKSKTICQPSRCDEFESYTEVVLIAKYWHT